ncbi:two-component regulator propeller domain-containing protein [Maribacter sp. LLG6340-A2]|uniref:hybrid sensor histidine kinase/response regulator transcription factor n=1 Tax=Maribacter sp. LLG6340-A2 TaxID=3160834 RepID=UPI003864791C
MKYWYSFILMVLAILSIRSQNLKFNHYNDNNGLSHNSVRYINQDKHGFLWFGTFSGLNRFDGYQFKQYLSGSTQQETLLNDDITALEIDEPSNTMWIGTRGGLTRFRTDTHTFRTYLPDNKKEDALPDQEIRSIYIDKFKRVWVGTKNKGLSILYSDKDSFEQVEIEGFNYVKDIFEDEDGNIWIGSYGSGGVAKIYLNASGAIQQIKRYVLDIPNSTEVNPYINFIDQDHKGDIFIGTREGLYKLDKKEDIFKNMPIVENGQGNSLGTYFLAIARAPDGKYWLGTLDGVVVCQQLEDLTIGKFELHQSVLSDGTSLVDNLVSALFFDKSGVLWLGTEDGLDKYDPVENQFALNKDISRLIGNKAPRIRGFSKAYDGKIVVATRNNGLFVSNGNGYSSLSDIGTDIASIYTVDGKIFYCGLWNGKVQVYDYVKKSTKIIDTGFTASPVLAFTQLSSNKILVSSFGEGMLILNTDNLTTNSYDERFLDGFQINTMVKDGNIIWSATETGIVQLNLDSGEFKVYDALSDEKINFPDANNVSDILKDNQNIIWASSRYGLSFYDSTQDKFQTYLKHKELSGRWVTDILTDSEDNLWLNMNNNSIAKLNTLTNEANIYQVNSGNRLDVFSSGGFYTADGKNVYLGAKSGIIHFTTETLERNVASTTPVISAFRIQNKEITPGMEVNGQIPLKLDINLSKAVVLNYDNRNFSLQFSEPTFANDKLNSFEYMLEGFDDQWITTTGFSRTVQYTNLFPDDYIFKIRSRNGNGQWSETASYAIKIQPPFWMTPKAIILFLAILGSAIYFIRREIKNRIRLKQELLTEKVNREHDVKLNNEKLRFFTNISHELRTPLTLILGPVKQLLEDSTQQINTYQKSRYELIHNNANRLFSLVNQVLDFRKAQSGELKLKTMETDILAYSKNIFDSYKELANNKNIELSFITENERIHGWIDNDKFDKILYNLLSNAIKFTPDFGNVELYLRYNEELGKLNIEVSDNGIGISKKSQKKIFNRFYQATTTQQNNTGSGIGLSLVQSLVELHKGNIEVKSNLDKGSVFMVELPIARKFYDDDEVFELSLSKLTENDEGLNDAPKKIIQDTGLKQKILVIDDNAELRKYLVDYLSGFYKVYEAENGEQALTICRQVRPTLCVSDVMMPIMNGLEFCEKLKNDQFISHIPVVLLTALSDNKDKVKGYGTGADGYLVKPFDPSLLKLMIENIIKTRLDLKAKFAAETESEVSLLTHSPVDKMLMRKITDLINDNMDKSELSTSFLCQELGMSSSKLYQKIKELTDLAPTEFIRTVRLKKSASLLKTKKYNVSEVTNLIGFNDPLYFSRCFKKQFGYPPSKLLK